MSKTRSPDVQAYSTAHITRRHELLPAAIGTPCVMCGYAMRIGQALDLDHTDPDAKQRGEPGDRIVHTVCNRRAGARQRGQRSRSRNCVICGAPYHAHHKAQQACSTACGWEVRRLNAPPKTTKTEPKPPRIKVEKKTPTDEGKHKCIECGVSTWTGKRGRPRKVCPSCSTTPTQRSRP